MNALIVGGAGFIGGVTTHLLSERGHKVIVLDNLSTGHKHNLPDGTIFIRGDMGDHNLVSALLKKHQVDIVLHFAAKIRADESVQMPYEYFQNNSFAALGLIDTAAWSGVQHYIFSSTAAVYGNPKSQKVTEDEPVLPINPYGFSKRITEIILKSYEQTHNLNWLAFRYFNTAGAYKNIGPDYPFRSHLIPNVIDRYLDGRPFTINGLDYKTKDGTCIRDYIHVWDVANAHVAAAELMTKDQAMQTIINLGTGQGNSIKQVLSTFESITGKKMEVTSGPRRPGDPDAYFATPDKAKKLLGWQSEKNLEDILLDALEWQQNKNKENVNG